MASFNDQRSADSVQANASRLADTAALSRSLAGSGTGRMFTSATIAAKIWRDLLGLRKNRDHVNAPLVCQPAPGLPLPSVPLSLWMILSISLMTTIIRSCVALLRTSDTDAGQPCRTSKTKVGYLYGTSNLYAAAPYGLWLRV